MVVALARTPSSACLLSPKWQTAFFIWIISTMALFLTFFQKVKFMECTTCVSLTGKSHKSQQRTAVWQVKQGAGDNCVFCAACSPYWWQLLWSCRVCLFGKKNKYIYICVLPSVSPNNRIQHISLELFCNSWSFFIPSGYLGFNRQEMQ